MSKHTPGYWMAVGYWVEHVDDDVPDICNCDPASMDQEGRSESEILANTKLLAAAPEMLAALKNIVSQIDQGGAGGKVFSRDACIAQARNAITKATGGAA